MRSSRADAQPRFERDEESRQPHLRDPSERRGENSPLEGLPLALRGTDRKNGVTLTAHAQFMRGRTRDCLSAHVHCRILECNV